MSNFALANTFLLMSPRFEKFIKWCRRYISVTLVAVLATTVFVLFLNDNSVMRTYEYRQDITRLEQEIKNCRDTLLHYRELNTSLETDRASMEKIVRENYHMQRPTEDVYLIDE